MHYLFTGLIAHYQGDDTGIETYSERALARVWKSERFSWSMTSMLHQFGQRSAFEQQLQASELAYLEESEAAQTVLAENYVGLPY